MSQLFTEINEQPSAIARLLDAESANVDRIAAALRGRDLRYVTIAARGTSDNAATYGKYVFAAFNHLPVALATPSLYTLYHAPPQLAGSLVIAISQSGESPDILEVVHEARRQNVPTLAVTNFENSPLAHAADFVLPQHAGEEKTVAATKTYTTQLAAMALFSVALAGDEARRRELAQIGDAIAKTLMLASPAKDAAARWRAHTTCLVIGRGYNYATAFEIALKLKELAYVMAEPFSSADFMHGPIAVIERGFPVVLVVPRGAVYGGMIGVTQELKARGADLAVISDAVEALALGDIALETAGVPEWLSPLTAVVPGQLIACYLTAAKGYDPDHPRGLTKVTRTI